MKSSRPIPVPGTRFDLMNLFEDSLMIAVGKPSGLLSVAVKGDEPTVFSAVMDYVRHGSASSRRRVFIVHRLDRDTSGVMLLAKSEEIQQEIQNNWDKAEKIYLAILRGIPAEKKGIVQSFLHESKAFRVYSGEESEESKFARTGYRVLKNDGTTSLVEVKPYTGRKNQIRVHMADIGCPVMGDRKYGDEKDKMRPMRLHSLRIRLPHPGNHKPLEVECPAPDYFGLDKRGKFAEKISE